MEPAQVDSPVELIAPRVTRSRATRRRRPVRISSLSPQFAGDVSPHLERALEERCRRYHKAFKRCQKAFSEDSVHQLRVETRRLIACLDLLNILVKRPELRVLRRALKKFFRGFARLRDTQVHLSFLDQHRRKFPEIGPWVKVLARREKRLIHKLDKQVSRDGRKKIEKLLALLRQVLDPALAEAGLRTRGAALVTAHARTAYKRVGALRRRINPERPLTVHRTRVAFKRYRYLLELLQPLLPWVSLRCLQEMHDYQTLMGEIQDLEVLQEALERFVEADPDAPQKLARFRRELERQHGARMARYLEAADQLLRFWPARPQTFPQRRSVRRG